MNKSFNYDNINSSIVYSSEVSSPISDYFLNFGVDFKRGLDKFQSELSFSSYKAGLKYFEENVTPMWKNTLEQNCLRILNYEFLNKSRINFQSKLEPNSAVSDSNKNPLFVFPFPIRENIASEIYEIGMSSMAQQYIEKQYCNKENSSKLQNIFNNIYIYSISNKKHTLAYNIILVLSQIPYKYLSTWALTLAVSATRSQFFDVMELGVRCFENWECKDACAFLKNCSFSESWLQKYADEVCEYLENKGVADNVLSEKNFAWKMARRESDSSSNIDGYSSRYRNI